jgi:LDH2 family malate/lactate/ureidoglycolate dehydrogenase
VTGAISVELDDISRWARDVFVAVGLSAEDAEVTVDSLAFAERRGVSTHGFMRVPIYVERILGGGISARGRTVIAHERGGLAIMDANNSIGAAAGMAATRLVIARAAEFGVATAIVRNANHFGAAAYYANAIADAGMFGIVVSNTDKAMSPPFGGSRVLGTNPLAIALPVPAEQRPQLDMATSEVSLGKVLMAAQAGRDIPLGWAVDADGEGTTSPRRALEGALLPSGGPKGFGLAFMIDGLVALSGAPTSPNVKAMYGDRSVPQDLGFAFVAIDAGLGIGTDEYAAAVADLVSDVHDAGPSVSGVPSLAPGEPELLRELSGSSVLEIVPDLVSELSAVGELVGVAFPTR